MDDITPLENKQLIARILQDSSLLAVRLHNVNVGEYADPVMQKPVGEFTLTDYQKSVLLTAGTNMSWRQQLMNAALGLGEAGEAQGDVKKFLYHTWSPIFHDAKGVDSVVLENHKIAINRTFREHMAAELGDIMFYVAWLAWLLDYPLNDIAIMNRAKLIGRHGEAEFHEAASTVKLNPEELR